MNYLIVNAASNRPIFAIGFCNNYTNKEEAEKAIKQWNNMPKWMNACKAKIIEKK